MKRYFLHDSRQHAPPFGARLLHWATAAAALVAVFVYCAHRSGYHWDWASVVPYWRMLLNGWATTLFIAAITLALSLAIGTGFALARRSVVLPLRYFSQLYVELIRGTPLLVQLLITFYIIANGFGLQNRYVVGALALSLFSGAYISEIIRGGIESIGATQWESARAIGLTTAQTYRYVILPQALRQMLPALASQFADIVKNSSLLSVLGIAEFTWTGQNVNSLTYSVFEVYLPLALGYLVITLPISVWTQRLERKHQFES